MRYVSNTYQVKETLVDTSIDTATRKINTRITFLPEYRMNHLIDTFRSIYRGQGTLTELIGKENDIIDI
jgi:hypothetical protein